VLLLAETGGPAKADKRTRSKWSRVLRYPAVYKPDSERLDQFIQRKGGINACAARFSRCLGLGALRGKRAPMGGRLLSCLTGSVIAVVVEQGRFRGLGIGEAGIDGFPDCAGTPFGVMLLRGLVWPPIGSEHVGTTRSRWN
jgi:hypothetical protein